MKKTAKESSTESERLAELAKSYLDMMEKQMTATISHPQFIETMLSGLQAMQRASTPKPEAYEPAARHTSAASGSYDDAYVRLERRVAFLERQLDELRKSTGSHAHGKSSTSSQSAKRAATTTTTKPVHPAPAKSMGVAAGARSKTRRAHEKAHKTGKSTRNSRTTK